jgi:hypothetical protein
MGEARMDLAFGLQQPAGDIDKDMEMSPLRGISTNRRRH